jgi:hypothetical protein
MIVRTKGNNSGRQFLMVAFKRGSTASYTKTDTFLAVRWAVHFSIDAWSPTWTQAIKRTLRPQGKRFKSCTLTAEERFKEKHCGSKALLEL